MAGPAAAPVTGFEEKPYEPAATRPRNAGKCKFAVVVVVQMEMI
jgi:hypothetical protein